MLGTGQRESRGVKRGYITDMAASEFAVREAVELAERMSGLTVEDVWASYGAGGLVSDVANVEVELGGHAVEQADIDELLDAGKEAIDRNGQVVLHAHPALYTIDRAQGVQQPIGLHANRLGVDIHVIAAEPSPLRNIDTVIRQAHLGVKAIVASPIAAALACLSEEERELGVALGRDGRGGDQRLGPLWRNAGRPALDPARRQGHHQRHRLRLRRAAARRRAAEMLLRLGDDQPARQSRDDRGDPDRRRTGRGADEDHPRAADDGHPPAGRGADQRNRSGAEGPRASPARSGARSC